MTFPTELPVRAITMMLGTEAAAAFDEITRKHVTEGLNEWPSTFRQGQFVPAVEYLRAARVRTKLMQAMAERMAKVDLYVGSGQDLSITNLTGHPTVVFPVGFRDRDGRPMPGSITLTGRLFEESTAPGRRPRRRSRPPATISARRPWRGSSPRTLPPAIDGPRPREVDRPRRCRAGGSARTTQLDHHPRPRP